MLEDRDRCELYEDAQPGEASARKRVLEELGAHALLPKPNPPITKKEELHHMASSPKKPTLRELAVAAGISKPNDLKLFQMDVDALLDLLKPEFPGIDELDEDGVLDLITAAKKKGKDGKDDEAPRGRGRGKEEPDEAPRGRGRAKVEEEAPRGRGRGKAEEEEAPRGRGRGRDEEPAKKKDEPEETPRGRGRGKAEEPPADEPRGRSRGRGARDEEPEVKAEKAPAGKDRGDEVTQLLEQVLTGQADIKKQLEALEAKVDSMDTGTAKALKGLKTQSNEIHAGVESLYLEDFDKKDKSLADVVKRISD